MGTRAPARSKGLLIYDGECGFCTRTAEWLRKRLARDYGVRPWQGIEDLRALGLDEAKVQENAYWVDQHGRRHRGHLAVIAALEASGGLLGSLSRAGRTRPLEPLAAWIYKVVARNRRRLPGATTHCRP